MQTRFVSLDMEMLQKSLQEFITKALDEKLAPVTAELRELRADLDEVKRVRAPAAPPRDPAQKQTSGAGNGVPYCPPANRAARFAYCGPLAPWDSTGATANTTLVQGVVVPVPQADALGTPTSCSTRRLTQVKTAPQRVSADSMQELRSESGLLTSPALECTTCQAEVYDPLSSWERNGFSPGNTFAKSGHTLDLVSPGRLTYGLDYKGNICGSKHGDPNLSELDSKPSLDYHVVQNIEPGMSTVSCYGMPWDSGLPGSFMLWDPGIQLHISVNRSCLDCLRGCTHYEEDYNAALRQETIGLAKADVNFTYYMVALLLPMMTFLLEFFLLYSVAQDSVIRHSYAQCKRAHLSVSRPEKGKSVALNSGCSAMVSWMAPIAYSHFLPKPWQPAQERYEHASTARSAIVELPPSATMPSNKVVVPYSSIEVTLVTTNSKVLQFISHLSHTPSSSLVNALRNYSVMWCLADAFLRLIKWWSDTQCVQPSSARFEALFSAEPRSTEIPTQVLVVGSVLHLFCSKATPSYLMTDFLVGGHQLKSIWGAQCVPCVSIKEVSEALS